MDRVQAPEAWIGEQVDIGYFLGNTSNILRYTLLAVGESGIVVKLTGEEDKSRFYPWSSVQYIEYPISDEPRPQSDVPEVAESPELERGPHTVAF